MIRYNPKGLTTPQIDESRRRHGDNVITPPKDDSAWRLLLEKFRDPIIRILLLAAVLSLIIGFVHKDFTESVGIICAIILATCVGFWFEWDAQRRFRRLNQVNDDIPVKVMREGRSAKFRDATWSRATWSTSRAARRFPPTANWSRPYR